MCGIFGVASSDRAITHQELSLVELGSSRLDHRGPDGGGYWSNNSVALGHRRLAIIDLSKNGHQPMVSVGGRYVIAYNGEIYNHRDLASELMAGGWRARGTSDTEVLLGAIEKWGVERTLNTLDGMFALAVYDSVRSILYLARDKFGEKPLHYLESHGMVWFSSELKGFEVLPQFDRRIDHRQISDYFRFGFNPGEQTVYANVHRVPPAGLLSWDLHEDKRSSTKYWHLSPRSSVDDEELFSILRSSTRRRLVSDRPLGIFLSGGVDSSLVAALAAEVSSEPIRTFNLSWSDREYDESQQAERVAGALGASHTRIRLTRSELVEVTGSLTSVLDEPFGDSSLLATTLVARSARESVVVALSGDGGDELFAGYNRHVWIMRLARLHRFPHGLRKRCAVPLARSRSFASLLLDPLPTRFRPRLIEDKILKLSRALAAKDPVEAYQSIVAIDDSVGSPLELAPEVRAGLRSAVSRQVLYAVRSADISSYLPDDILTKVDRATMSCGLESRTPFLNAELASAALSVGPAELIDRHGGKAPLRRLLAVLLPNVSFSQPKTGFGIPVSSLLRGELRPLIYDAITVHESRGLPHSQSWRPRMRLLEAGDDAPQHQLWSLLAFELWATDKRLSFS